MIEDLLSLRGRKVIVAGAAGGGLGTRVTQLLAQAGATVIAASRTPEKIARDLQPLVAAGLSVIPVQADVETDAGIATVMEQAAAAPGDLHGLVNVVGGGPAPTWGPSTRATRETWRSLFSVNVESMFFMTQAVAAELKRQQRPGSLVSISSITGFGAQPYAVAYTAAKSAVLSVTRTLALEWAPDNIRVNAIAPGAMTSPMSLLPPDPVLERRAIPLGRKGDLDEFAHSVLFLLSDMSTYMTGQCVTLDGGISLKWSHLNEENTPVLITNEAFLKQMKGE